MLDEEPNNNWKKFDLKQSENREIEENIFICWWFKNKGGMIVFHFSRVFTDAPYT